jgi:uncharacterized phage protein (TIGR02216 family)
MTERTQWALWLAQAHRALALPPEQFWRLSLREWRALNHRGESPMTKQEFVALAARYPD